MSSLIIILQLETYEYITIVIFCYVHKFYWYISKNQK